MKKAREPTMRELAREQHANAVADEGRPSKQEAGLMNGPYAPTPATLDGGQEAVRDAQDASLARPLASARERRNRRT